MKKPTGRKPLWTSEIEDAICTVLRNTGCSMKDAAIKVGIAESTFHNRMALGEGDDADDADRLFSERVRKAQVDGKLMDLGTVSKAAMGGDWRAAAWRLERKFPNEFGPRIRIHVEAEVGQMIQKLKEEFANEPALLERALSCLAGEKGTRLVEGSVVGGEPGEDAVSPRVDSPPLAAVRTAEASLEDAELLGENREG